MRIVDVKFHMVSVDFRTWVFVKVETSDDGLFGWGEATVEWKARSVVAALEELRELCIGEDPTRIRHLMRKLIKRHYWDPGVIGMSGISGIEAACWDILGKSVGKPVVDLLGGPVRDRVPVYTHLGYGKSDDVYKKSLGREALETINDIASRGYHAVKVVNVPFHNQFVFSKQRHAYFDLLDEIFDAARGKIDVALDVHGRCGSLASAQALLSFLAGKGLLFVEEIMRPTSASTFAELAHGYDVILATGERLVEVSRFADLAAAHAVSVFQPDLAHCGGLMQGMQIAGIADAFGITMAPHNPLGIVASTVGLHYALATPNFLIQEEMSAHFSAAKDFVSHPIRFEDGYWTLEPCVGLGLKVDEQFLAKIASREEPLLTASAFDADGSIVDW